MSFIECRFEYSIAGEPMSDGEYKTGKEARAAAEERWQEMCDAEDGHLYGRGWAEIFCLDADTGAVQISGEVRVYSERGLSPKEIGGGA